MFCVPDHARLNGLREFRRVEGEFLLRLLEVLGRLRKGTLLGPGLEACLRVADQIRIRVGPIIHILLLVARLKRSLPYLPLLGLLTQRTREAGQRLCLVAVLTEAGSLARVEGVGIDEILKRSLLVELGDLDVLVY